MARRGWETEAERRRVPPCRSVRLGPTWARPGPAGKAAAARFARAAAQAALCLVSGPALSVPTPPWGFPAGSPTPPESVGGRGRAKGGIFLPLFAAWLGLGSPFLVVGVGGQQAAWGGEAGWGTCFPLLCGLPFALEEGERGARVVRWLGNLCAPRFRSWGRGSSGSFSNPTMFAAQFAFSYGAPGKDPLNQYP